MAEANLLGLSKMNCAVLSVYVDSATDLPLQDVIENPDPFAVVSVGKTKRLTSVKKDTDNPVWEQGFSFFVASPEQETVNIRIIAQSSKKKGECIGQFSYNISELLSQNELKNLLQSFQLKKSGPTSKIQLAMGLKILKRTAHKSLEPIELKPTKVLQRQETSFSSDSSTSSSDSEDERKHKIKLQNVHQMSLDNSTGLGSINLTLHYNSKNRILSVTVHKVM